MSIASHEPHEREHLAEVVDLAVARIRRRLGLPLSGCADAGSLSADDGIADVVRFRPGAVGPAPGSDTGPEAA